MYPCQEEHEDGIGQPASGRPVSDKGGGAGTSGGPHSTREPPRHSNKQIWSDPQPGKWQLIVDLSYPAGSSVNDGIEPKLC